MTWSSSNTSIATVSTSGEVTAVAPGECSITATAKDGSGVNGTCEVTVKLTGINGHEYVEIGGLTWATMNVGATTVAGSYETCYGDYFAYSETEPRYISITRTAADAATLICNYGYSSDYSPTYYSSLDADHDAATANWGGSWRTPNRNEFRTLAKACSGSNNDSQQPIDIELISTITKGGIYWLSSTQTIEPAYTGVAGLLFVSASDISKRVFFPASGYIRDMSLMSGGAEGVYWSSSVSTYYSSRAYNLDFKSSSVSLSGMWSDGNESYFGFTVRPVSD